MIGKAIAHYLLESRLGAGGIGEVYQARDTRLGRSVAVKMLPEVFERDPERVARFEREAKLLASLNHPNIAALYGLEQSDGKHFLVMELVEGETLAERIRRGPLPVEEALQIAHQIAEALEAAHEKNVIHRDLKPANLKITPEGKVKVLDFGLAKALEGVPAQLTSNSPTLLSAVASNAGTILGTAGFMSPEQARGHEADQRSDIFSFGCVLYEMLTGRQTFTGETVTDIIASVVARDPDFTALPANLHRKLPDIIRRCLAKNRKDRWHAIADLRVELESVIADPHGRKLQATQETSQLPLWRRAVPFAITAAIVAALAVLATIIVMSRQPSAPAAVTRFSFVLPEGQTLTNTSARHQLAISPDGTKIVYTADRQLYLRGMADMEARPILGTAQIAGTMPFFSPDGQWVGYSARADNKLKKISITGGAAVTICDLDEASSFGSTWASDGYIYVGQAKGIIRVSANGGKPEKIVTLKEREQAHRPQLLPGGDAILFTLRPDGADTWDKAQVVVQVLKSGERKVVIPGGSDARYVPTGHIVYTLGNVLLAVPFDVKKLRVTGGPVPILEGVRRSTLIVGGGADAQFAYSDNGSLVYLPGTQTGAGDLTLWLVDRSGGRKNLNVPPGAYSQPRISPNGKQLAVFTDDGKDAIVWIYDLSGAAPIRRLTFGGRNHRPAWTPDGQRIAFTSDRDGNYGLFWQRADGTGMAERLGKVSDATAQSEFWTPDGKVLVFRSRSAGVGTIESLMMLAVGDVNPKTLIPRPAGNASLSPDGKWIAHTSEAESVRGEVFVQPFPPNGTKYQVTTSGGGSPLWSPDGKQIFYHNQKQMFAVNVQTQPTFVPGKTTPLPIQGIVIPPPPGPRPYDITPDGKYFVVMFPKTEAEGGKAPPEQLNITLNWFEELKQRVPIK